jgi:hypothetical protein
MCASHVMQVLGYQKVSAVQVPKRLNDEHKASYMGIFLEHVLRYESEGDKFLYGIDRGYES